MKFVLLAVSDYEQCTTHVQFLSQGMRVLQRDDVSHAEGLKQPAFDAGQKEDGNKKRRTDKK